MFQVPWRCKMRSRILSCVHFEWPSQSPASENSSVKCKTTLANEQSAYSFTHANNSFVIKTTNVSQCCFTFIFLLKWFYLKFWAWDLVVPVWMFEVSRVAWFGLIDVLFFLLETFYTMSTPSLGYKTNRVAPPNNTHTQMKQCYV